MGRIRNADTARLGQAFQARSHIDTVTKNVVAIDQDIAKVDANAKQHLLVVRDFFVALGHRGLHFDGAGYRLNNAGEFQKQAVTSLADQAPLVVLHQLRQGIAM